MWLHRSYSRSIVSKISSPLCWFLYFLELEKRSSRWIDVKIYYRHLRSWNNDKFWLKHFLYPTGLAIEGRARSTQPYSLQHKITHYKSYKIIEISYILLLLVMSFWMKSTMSFTCCLSYKQGSKGSLHFNVGIVDVFCLCRCYCMIIAFNNVPIMNNTKLFIIETLLKSA